MKRGKSGKIQSLFWLAVEATPVLLPLALAGFSCVAMVLLVAGRLTNTLTWSFGLLVVVIVTWLLCRQFPISRPGTVKEKRLIDLLVLGGVGIWILFNLFFTAQSVFVARDPGIYTLAGKWLITHQTTDIKTPPISEHSDNLVNYSSGIWLTYTKDSTTLQPQGSHLLSVMLGLSGRIFGEKAIYKLNVFFGGIALLAIYAFARQMMKPKWAALVVVILGLSLPMMYFSRDTYTEMLAAIFTFGALALVWLAQSTKGKKALVLWGLAGLTAGATFMSRPDGFFPAIAVGIYLVVALALAKKNERFERVRNSLAFLALAIVPIIIGWLDLSVLSNSYYHGIRQEVAVQIMLLVFEIIMGIVIIAVCWKTNLLKYADKKTKSWRSNTGAILVVVGFLLLLARPILLFNIDHRVTNQGLVWGTFVQPLLRGVTSPRFAYDSSIDWIGWYIGLPMLVLGIVGLAIAGSKILKEKASLLLLPSVALIGLLSILYGLSPKITADQVWAIRRYLPVILPGMAVFGVYALEKIVAAMPKHELKKVFLPMALIFIIMQPLLTSRPFLAVAEKSTNLAAINAFCAALPKNAEVVWLNDISKLDAVQSTRAYCGVKSLGYVFGASPAYMDSQNLDQPELKRIAAGITARGGVPILAMRGSQRHIMNPASITQFTPVTIYSGLLLETPVYGPPREAVNVSDSIEIALIKPDGSLAKITRN